MIVLHVTERTPSRSEEVERTAARLRREGLDFALLSSPANVTYAAGFEAPIQLGPIWEVCSWLPLTLALVSADGSGLLIAADAYAGLAAQSWFDHVHSYDSLGHFEEFDPPASFRRALGAALAEAGLNGKRAVLGVEPSLPLLAREVLFDAFPGVELRDASLALEEARSIKTDREIALLREAALVASAAQTRLRELAASASTPGSDIDVWIELLRAMEARTSRHLIVTGELVTGPRTAQLAPGGPVGREIQTGDAALLDISPRVDGYWADCTNTVVFGAEPTDEQRKYFDAARDSCEAAMATLRPGAKCSDAAEAVRATMERYGLPVAHYTGHQIGTSTNERPRLVTYDHSIIEPGMVFCVEPGAYAGEGGTAGARAEKTVLVTDDGPEILSQFEWGF
jgi:Xaa-Pro aminopeptidase